VAFEERSDTESSDFLNTDALELCDRKELAALLPNRIAAMVLMTSLKRHLAQSLETPLNRIPAGEAARRLLMMACIVIPKHLLQPGGELVVMNASGPVPIRVSPNLEIMRWKFFRCDLDVSAVQMRIRSRDKWQENLSRSFGIRWQ
jgi:hypothetical protein